MPYAVMLNDNDVAKMDATTERMLTYILESRQKFVEGKEPLTNYDNYLEQLRLLGSDEYVKIWQECYDAYRAREVE